MKYQASLQMPRIHFPRDHVGYVCVCLNTQVLLRTIAAHCKFEPIEETTVWIQGPDFKASTAATT